MVLKDCQGPSPHSSCRKEPREEQRGCTQRNIHPLLWHGERDVG